MLIFAVKGKMNLRTKMVEVLVEEKEVKFPVALYGGHNLEKMIAEAERLYACKGFPNRVKLKAIIVAMKAYYDILPKHTGYKVMRLY